MRSQVIRTISSLLFLGLIGVPVAAQTGNQIELHRKFLSSLKYSYGDNAPQGVYTFSGLSFQSSFKEVLGMHPDALAEANKSLSRNAIMLIGSFTMLAGSAMLLSDTLNDVEDLSNDQFPDESNSTTPLIVIVAGGIMYVAGALSSGGHLTNAVRMFNNFEKQAVRDSGKSTIHMSVSPRLFGCSAGLGLSVRWP